MTTQLTTPSSKKKAANRRVRKTKTPTRVRTNMDPNQVSGAGMTGSDSLVWNVNSMAIPRFGRSDRFDNVPHNIIQTIDLGTVFASSTSSPTGYALGISATSHVTQYSSWATTFDQYKIREVELWLVPSIIGTGNALGTQTVYSVVDYDDATTPTSAAQLMQYSNVMVSSANSGHYRKWMPHIAVGAFQGAFTGFKNEPADWIDAASSSVVHYGFKAFVDQAASSATAVSFQIFLRIWIQFRNVY